MIFWGPIPVPLIEKYIKATPLSHCFFRVFTDMLGFVILKLPNRCNSWSQQTSEIYHSIRIFKIFSFFAAFVDFEELKFGSSSKVHTSYKLTKDNTNTEADQTKNA